MIFSVETRAGILPGISGGLYLFGGYFMLFESRFTGAGGKIIKVI